MDQTSNSSTAAIENLTIIDNDDDVPLISISSRSNKQKCCCLYWMEVFFSVGILILSLSMIALGFLLIRDPPKNRTSIKGCNTPSRTGKSCSIDNLETKIALNITRSSFSYPYQQQSNNSFVFTALSNKTILTFSVGQGQRWNIDRISIRDILNDQELIEDGQFQSGTSNAFCLCDSTFHLSKPRPSYTSTRGNTYGFQIDSFFSSVMLAQSVETIQGRIYNISFWLEYEDSQTKNMLVYISSSASTWTVFSFLFVILHLFKKILFHC